MSRRTESLDAGAARGGTSGPPSYYSTLPDTKAVDPALAAEQLDEAYFDADGFESDRATRRACRLAGIRPDDFASLLDRGFLSRHRIKRFTCTTADEPLRRAGETRQATSKRIRGLLAKARLAVPLRAILAGDVRRFAEWFSITAATTWKGGAIEDFVKLRPVIEGQGPELREQVEEAAVELLGVAKGRMRDDLKSSWDGTEAPGRTRFLQVYNQLRVAAVFAPRRTYDYLAGLRPQLRSGQFWLVRAVDRALHLTNNAEAGRAWVRELSTLMDYESHTPATSLSTAAYIGLYYADRLTGVEWAGVRSSTRLSSPWEPSTLQKVLNESWENTREAWYQSPEQVTINLLRVALYLRCHPDRDEVRSRGKWMVRMLAGWCRRQALPDAARKPLSFLNSLLR